MWHTWERREKCTRSWWKSLREGDHLEDQGVGGKMGSQWILGKLAWGVWIGFDWLRTGHDRFLTIPFKFTIIHLSPYHRRYIV
jgi:hypothetical protein